METKNGKTVVMVYYNNIDSNETCEEFKAYRTHSVAKQKPASVVVYDYYDNCKLNVIKKKLVEGHSKMTSNI